MQNLPWGYPVLLCCRGLFVSCRESGPGRFFPYPPTPGQQLSKRDRRLVGDLCPQGPGKGSAVFGSVYTVGRSGAQPRPPTSELAAYRQCTNRAGDHADEVIDGCDPPTADTRALWARAGCLWARAAL